MSTTEKSLHTRLSELLAGETFAGKHVRKYKTLSFEIYALFVNSCFWLTERLASSNAKVPVGAIATIDNTIGDTFVSRIYQV